MIMIKPVPDIVTRYNKEHRDKVLAHLYRTRIEPISKQLLNDSLCLAKEVFENYICVGDNPMIDMNTDNLDTALEPLDITLESVNITLDNIDTTLAPVDVDLMPIDTV